jgi:hypothetical protein
MLLDPTIAEVEASVRVIQQYLFWVFSPHVAHLYFGITHEGKALLLEAGFGKRGELLDPATVIPTLVAMQKVNDLEGYAVSTDFQISVINQTLALGSVKIADKLSARCAFSDRNSHSRMPLDPTHVRLKLLHACDQWHSFQKFRSLTS